MLGGQAVGLKDASLNKWLTRLRTDKINLNGRQQNDLLKMSGCKSDMDLALKSSVGFCCSSSIADYALL